MSLPGYETITIVDRKDSPHYIFEELNFNIRYVRLRDSDIPKEKWLN